APGRDALARATARRRLGHGVREPVERHRRLRALPPREDRPAVRAPRDRNRSRRRVQAADGRRLMGRLPIRVRLTLPFAFAMALVLAALGSFVYVRVGSTLLANVDAGLRGQSKEAISRLRDNESLLDRDATESGIAQLLTTSGTVVQS